MAIDITAVHMETSKGYAHEHIGSVKWRNPASGKTGESTRQSIVDWLKEDTANQAYVQDGVGRVPVGVVNATPPYLRTYADGRWTDNLLALPRY